MRSALNADRKQIQDFDGWGFCHAILPDVSRTFALTIPVLPDRLADSVCVAYLLCRIADTIEDRADLPPALRDDLYSRFADLVRDPPPWPDARVQTFLQRWPRERNRSYQALVEGMGQVLAAFASLDEQERAPIDDCVQEMIDGMRHMTHQRPNDGVTYVCEDLDQLEDYCHYVAGTVGLMLTRQFETHLGSSRFSAAERPEQGRRFGLGLQLTNILKDHRTDVKRGTSFMPRSWLDGHRGELRAEHRRQLILRTVDHLDMAQRYTLALPPRAKGIRMFCLWASWMAIATLREVARDQMPRQGDKPDHQPPPKISRDELSDILDYTRRHASDDIALDNRFAEMKSQTLAAVAELG